jgi:hypothetical protein
MKMPELFYNQGYIYRKTNTPYQDIFDRIEASEYVGWGVQNGQKVFMIECSDHEWDCCCIECIDDDTVTEHLEWIDWYRRTQLGGEEE